MSVPLFGSINERVYTTVTLLLYIQNKNGREKTKCWRVLGPTIISTQVRKKSL